MTLKLYEYWRSSAAYRLRIALNLKNVPYESVAINLHPDHREHLSPAYQALNPQMRVPAIEVEGEVIGQSMAILEWLDETWPDRARLLPEDPILRLKARAFAQTIASDVHPLNNPVVLSKLKQDYAATPDQVATWYRDWIEKGFAALEARYGQTSETRFLFGDAPSLAEICLIPQIYNARRFEVPLTEFPRLVEIDALCQSLPAFAAAAPEQVKPD